MSEIAILALTVIIGQSLLQLALVAAIIVLVIRYNRAAKRTTARLDWWAQSKVEDAMAVNGRARAELKIALDRMQAHLAYENTLLSKAIEGIGEKDEPGTLYQIYNKVKQ